MLAFGPLERCLVALVGDAARGDRFRKNEMFLRQLIVVTG